MNRLARPCSTTLASTEIGMRETWLWAARKPVGSACGTWGERLGRVQQQLGGAAATPGRLCAGPPVRQLLLHAGSGGRPVEPRVPQRQFLVVPDPLVLVRLAGRFRLEPL
jgi:hypothetical protein